MVATLGIATAEELAPQTAAEERGSPVAPLRILLAEDGLVNQKVAVSLLEQRGHEVMVANDGQEALAALERRSFDVVLMDVQMPTMDGLEATALIRRKEQESGLHTPIIAMTAYAMKGDRERCLAAGMDGYIAKPIRAKDLYAVVEGIVAGARGSPAQDRGTAQNQETIDRASVLEQTGGSVETLRELVELFAKECPKLMSKMRDAITNNASSELQQAAHTLKGSIQIFGAKRPAAAALRLETMGRDRNLAGAEEAWAALIREIDWLMPILADLPKS
jgi:CheY-like chemotaxis protein